MLQLKLEGKKHKAKIIDVDEAPQKGIKWTPQLITDDGRTYKSIEEILRKIG